MKKYLPILRNSPFFKGLTDQEILSILHCVNAATVFKERDSYGNTAQKKVPKTAECDIINLWINR